jgi:cytosine/uracil/thiamine/allantoin permease
VDRARHRGAAGDPGFVRAATTPGGTVANSTLLDSLYTYAWFVTFGLSFTLYLALARRP